MVTAGDLMSDDYLSVDVNDTVASFIGKLKSRKHGCALVFDSRKYLGMLTKDWLLTSRIDVDVMKIRNIVKHRSKSKAPFFVPKLIRNSELHDICRLMAAADVGALPVVESEKVLGIVCAADVLREIAQEYANVAVSRLATSSLVMLSEDDEIGYAINLMSKSNIGRLPVINSDNNLVGILSVEDIINKYQTISRCAGVRIPSAASHQGGKRTGFGTGESHDALKLPIRNFIESYGTICKCSKSDSVADAIKLMLKQDVSSILIVDRDSPKGILTVNNILRDYVKSKA
jgi:predicted transcriptional regulator